MSPMDNDALMKMESTIMQKVEFRDPGILFLSKGNLDNGNNYWAYLMVPEDSLTKYLEAKAANKPIDIREYGHIISWGEGDEPPQQTKDEMKEVYNANANFAAEFVENLEKSRDGQRFLRFVKDALKKENL